MRKTFLTVISLLALLAALSFAQTGQTGGIRGTVTIEEEGTALPGVTVTLRSPAMILDKLTTVTNDKGQYRFLNQAPGKYELTFEMSGFATVIRKNIVVSTNLTFTVDVQLSVERIEETVVVTGQAPTIDRQSTAKTTILDKVFLESIPAPRWGLDYFNMAPGITGNTVLGSSVRENSYNVDGIQVNDPDNGTYTGIGFSNIDIVEEFSVQAGGLDAEHGSVRGGVLNIVTKSGGNNFSGTVQLLYEHENLVSDNTKGTPLEGGLVGNKFWVEPSFTLGGPVIRDKLWFFTSFTYQTLERFFPGFPHDKETEVPMEDTYYLPFIKLSYQPSPKDKFTLGFQYNYEFADPSWPNQWQNEDSAWEYLGINVMPSFIWTHTFGPNLITNFKFGALFFTMQWNAQEHAKVAWYVEDTTGLETGSTGWDDQYQRNRFQLAYNGTLFVDDLAGSHEFKFGIQSSLGHARRKTVCYGPQDSQGFPRTSNWTWYGELYYAGWWAGYNQVQRVFNAGVFINDAWNVTKNLTINFGVRFDYQRNYYPKQDGTVGDIAAEGNFAHIGWPEETWDLSIDDSVTMFDWKNLTPRIGIIYDLFGDGKTLLKANFGQYLMENRTDITWYVNPVTWVGYEGYTDAEGNLTWLDYIAAPGAGKVTIGYQGEGLKTPSTYEIIVAIERELWEDMSVSARFIRRWESNLWEDVDATTVDLDRLMQDGEVVFDERWQEVQTVDPYDGRTITFYQQLWWEPRERHMVNPPGLDRDYTSVEFTLRKRFSKGWAFDMSYVYNKAEGWSGNSYWQAGGYTGLYDNPNDHVNAYGHLDLERQHQFKLTGLVKGPFGINISGYFRYLSGRPLNRWVNSWHLDLGFWEWIKAERTGTYRLDHVLVLDLRLEKEFRIGEKYSIRLFADVFNAFNDNKAWGKYDTSSSPWVAEFGEMTSIQDPRVFRIGARIAFDL
jgi:hypothetical protein